jgi:hypothetical protein
MGISFFVFGLLLKRTRIKSMKHIWLDEIQGAKIQVARNDE